MFDCCTELDNWDKIVEPIVKSIKWSMHSILKLEHNALLPLPTGPLTNNQPSPALPSAQSPEESLETYQRFPRALLVL